MGDVIRYKELADPRCKACDGRGKLRRIVNGEREKSKCRCVRLRDIKRHRLIPTIGGKW